MMLRRLFMPVVLLSSLLSFLLIFSPARGHQFKGNLCIVNNVRGICLPLQQCPSVYEELGNCNPPSVICGYVGSRPFVCCPPKTGAITTTTERTTSPTTTGKTTSPTTTTERTTTSPTTTTERTTTSPTTTTERTTTSPTTTTERTTTSPTTTEKARTSPTTTTERTTTSPTTTTERTTTTPTTTERTTTSPTTTTERTTTTPTTTERTTTSPTTTTTERTTTSPTTMTERIKAMTTTKRTTTTEKPPDSGPSTNYGAVAKERCGNYSRMFQKMHGPNFRETEYSTDVEIELVPLMGGSKVAPKEYPYMAAVGYNTTERVAFNCGGSLISERFVLTASHCLFDTNWGSPAWVRVGDMNLERTDDEAKPQEVRVIKRIRHPDYQRPSQYHDIGLLELESAVTFDEWVRPICLPYSKPDTGNEDVATAVGWGKVDWDDDIGSSDMLKVTIKLVDNARCNKSVHDDSIAPLGIVEDWQICAGEPGKDTCQGDSGGPLVILNQDYNCMYSIVGITSFGGYCGSIIPGVYTRVSNYLPWIERIVWPDLV